MSIMQKQYYCLVAGLIEYSTDADLKSFDAVAVREQILDQIGEADKKYVTELFTYYDIENIINIKKGSSAFNTLGNFSAAELEEQLANPESLPEYLASVVSSRGAGDESAESLEKSLYEAYYKSLLGSKNKFLREYGEFDLNLRNVSAALTAQKLGVSPEPFIVGDNFVAESLKRNSSSDFGLKGELSYIDDVIAAVAGGGNLVQKERDIDTLRWSYIDDMLTFEYFSLSAVLGYLVKLCSVQRWKNLNSELGEAVFKQLMARLVDKSLANNA